MITDSTDLKGARLVAYRMAPAMCCASLLMAGASYGQGDIDGLIGYLAAAVALVYVRIRLRRSDPLTTHTLARR